MDPNSPQDKFTDTGQPAATPKQQVVERVRQAANVLVTVKSNPSVDELAATIGLTLMLNKLGKHATAVFSGQVPSTLEFLKPDETLESNTDSLRDFIVSLDKSKADKLRYKVEENVVKIFITPYRTSISQDDLEFTQGDFNVDVVLALGVTQREELDQAIMAHGRILHDATVATITAGQDHSELGQINWQEPGASSLSEMLVSISEAFQGGLIDEQIATAFLTGIVAETQRFSNPKTSPKVMTMAAQLMAAGANQQLIANELEKAVEVDLGVGMQGPVPSSSPVENVSVGDDGSLSISHDNEASQQPAELPVAELPELAPEASALPLQPPSELQTEKFLQPEAPGSDTPESVEPLMTGINESAEPTQSEPESPAPALSGSLLPPPPGLEMPIMGGPADQHGDIHIDTEGNLMRKAAVEPKHRVIQPLAESAPVESPAPMADSSPGFKLPPPPEMDLTPSGPIKDDTTLSEIEASVHSPHVQQPDPLAGVDTARDAVSSALAGVGFDPSGQARADLNAMPLGAPPAPAPYGSYRLDDSSPVQTPNVTDVSGSLPPELQQPGQDSQLPPPPVPPPMLPQQ